MRPLQPGDPDRVGPYRLLARLGAGGMGVVYLGWSPGGRAVAVKVVRERFASDFEFRARFRREVAAARTVTGAFTAPVLDADPAAAAPWLVTAYLPGLSLREAVEDGGSLPPAALIVLAAGMAEALVDIHRAGLVHRDLKPDNVMLTAEGPRVIDFGIARPTDATAITQVGAIIGTPSFMSPEQIASGVAGPASDVFSFGAVLAFAATGRQPFGAGATLATLYRVLDVETDLSLITEPWLHDVVAACLRREAGERPSAAQILDLLGERTDAVAAGGWLPAPLAEEIDRRAAQARQWPAPSTGKPDAVGPAIVRPDAGADPAVEPARMSAEASGRPSVGPAKSSWLNRRRLLVGAAALAAAAGGFAVALQTARPEESTSLAGSTPPSRPPSAPPRAARRWRVKVSDYYPEELFTTEGVVVVSTPEEEMYALAAQTGRRLWKHPATLVGTVAGGLVFEAQNINPRLARIDPVTGAERWAYSVPFDEMPLRLAVGGSLVCFAYQRIRALDVADGRSRWTAAVNAEIGLVASGGALIAASRTELAGLDLRTGRLRWKCPLDYVLHLLAGDGMVFAVDQHWDLHTIRLDDGTAVWTKPAFSSLGRPQWGGGTLYASDDGGEVFALKCTTGERLWSRKLGQPSALELADGTLYAACADKTLYALDATHGRLLWTYGADVVQPTRAKIAALASRQGQAFVGVKAGYVEAIATPAGGSRAGA